MPTINYELNAATGWRKSTHSGNQDYAGTCVEVTTLTTDNTLIGIRDTKQHGTGPVLAVKAAGMRRLVNQIHRGELDLPA